MNTTDPFTTAPQPRKARRWPAILATGVGALIMGTVIGSAGGAGSAEAEPTSATTVTATATTTATAEPEVKTVSEEVEVTPQSCLDYIDASTEALGLAGDTIGDLSEGMGIASEVMSNPFTADQHIDTLMSITDDIEARNAEFDPLSDRMVGLATDCRS